VDSFTLVRGAEARKVKIPYPETIRRNQFFVHNLCNPFLLCEKITEMFPVIGRTAAVMKYWQK
jgi:hypothetical protein